MTKFLCGIACLLIGCGPLSLSVDANWGINGNQTVEKTLKVTQKQTPAQTEAQSDIIGDIVKVIPFLTPEPTPTPFSNQQKVKSITIELEPKAAPEIPVYTHQPYLPPARKPKAYATPCKN